MEAEVRHLESLLELLKEKTGEPLDKRGFESMEELTGVKAKYMYESILLRIRDARRKRSETLNLHETKLDKLATYLGEVSYRTLARKLNDPPHAVLKASVGTYYCFVRRNDGPAVLLRSPVRIEEKNGKFYYTLKGPVRLYTGELSFTNGCLFVLMREPKGKQVHHIYNVGQSTTHEILQGIFSAVTTNFEPIGGRTLLVRASEDFNKMKPAEFTMSSYANSKAPEAKQIAAYFKEYQKNNLKLTRAVTYTKDDLTGN